MHCFLTRDVLQGAYDELTRAVWQLKEDKYKFESCLSKET